MNKKVMGKCPVCNDDLVVSKLTCKSCNSTIEGNFSLCSFCKLSEEQKDFINLFVKSKGNIKEIEKEMGISYPTVRGKLENIIETLNMIDADDKVDKKKKVNKREVLHSLSAGKISTEEAIKLLD